MLSQKERVEQLHINHKIQSGTATRREVLRNLDLLSKDRLPNARYVKVRTGRHLTVLEGGKS